MPPESQTASRYSVLVLPYIMLPYFSGETFEHDDAMPLDELSTNQLLDLEDALHNFRADVNDKVRVALAKVGGAIGSRDQAKAVA